MKINVKKLKGKTKITFRGKINMEQSVLLNENEKESLFRQLKRLRK